MGERHEVILGQDDIYNRIFSGRTVSKRQMFTNIRRYSPTGILRNMPHTKENVSRYNSSVRERIRKVQ